MNAFSIAKALNGVSTGRGWLCRCPVRAHGRGRGDHHPSLSICDGDARLLIHCHASCDTRDVLAELRSRGLIDNENRRSRDPSYIVSSRSLEDVDPIPDPRAVALWRGSTPIDATPAEIYLRARGFETIPASLRYSPSEGAMVAALQVKDRQLIGLQLTRLTTDGKKRWSDDCRRTIGAMHGAAVRLAPAGAVLGLAEGIESALAAMAITGIPTWASLGAKRLSQVDIPASVDWLHVFADDDEPGRDAANTVVRSHRHRRKVSVHLPPDGFVDWNDFWLAREFVA